MYLASPYHRVRALDITAGQDCCAVPQTTSDDQLQEEIIVVTENGATVAPPDTTSVATPLSREINVMCQGCGNCLIFDLALETPAQLFAAECVEVCSEEDMQYYQKYRMRCICGNQVVIYRKRSLDVSTNRHNQSMTRWFPIEQQNAVPSSNDAYVTRYERKNDEISSDEKAFRKEAKHRTIRMCSSVFYRESINLLLKMFQYAQLVIWAYCMIVFVTDEKFDLSRGLETSCFTRGYTLLDMFQLLAKTEPYKRVCI